MGVPYFDSVIEDAQSAGASSEQIALLQGAAESGALTLESLQEAIDATFACFDDAGLSHVQLPRENYQGIEVLPYTFGEVPGVSPEQSLAIADECIYRHSYFVEQAYALQPTSREAYDEYFEANVRPRLIVCLQDLGLIGSGDFTNDELWQIAADFYAEEARQHVDAGLPGTLTSCVADIVRTF